MSSTKELRRRIRSVKNISQITKAMQMVAATKMRRAQNQALGGRPYSETLQQVIVEMLPAIEEGMNPLLKPNSSEKIAVLLLTTDKSLCGSLVANVLRLAQNFSREHKDVEFITVGKKGRDFVVKTGKSLIADFENPDVANYKSAKQIANLVIQLFLEQKIGHLYLLYPNFVSTLKQDPTLEKILPISQEELLNGLNLMGLSQDRHSRGGGNQPGKLSERISGNAGNDPSSEFIFDIEKQLLLEFVLSHFVEQKIFQSMLETKASEHSARMIAMKNATDSALELVSDLQLAYNQTRQEGITRELLEITSALAALE